MDWYLHTYQVYLQAESNQDWTYGSPRWFSRLVRLALGLLVARRASWYVVKQVLDRS